MSSIDRNTGDDSDKVNHVNSIDVWMIADMRRFLGGQFITIWLEVDKLTNSNKGVEFDEVDKTVFDVKWGNLFLKQILRKLILTIIINLSDKIE